MKTLEVLDKVLKGKRVGWSARKNYRLAFESLAKYSEDWPVSGVVISEWLASLEGYTDTTVKLMFKMVKAGANYMKKAWKVDNPFEDGAVETPKVERKRRRYFTVDEVVAIARACRGEFEQVLIASLLDSSCRIGELAGIMPDGVGESWIMVTGKTGQRKYRMDAMLCERMRVMGEGGLPVFHNKKGEALTAGALRHRVEAIMKRAGLTGDKLGPHTLRHTAGSIVASETGSGLMVKALLQHDDIKTSMLYIHDVEDEMAQQVSPLKLISEKYRSEHNEGNGDEVEAKQIGFGEEAPVGTELVPVEVDEATYDIEDAMYSDVPDGASVRPLLKEADLRLLRRVFVYYAKNGESLSDELACRELLRRILRKVK